MPTAPDILLLTPTALELAGLGDGWSARVHLATCGFGPVLAGIGAVRQMLALPDVKLCILAGIGGTYDPARAPVGSVVLGNQVSLWGVGLAEELDIAPAARLGLPEQIVGPATVSLAPAPPELANCPSVPLLTVTAASASPQVAAQRRAAFPQAVVEEMEAYAVALAARQAQLPLLCVRGISNVVGQRDKAQWRSADALMAVRQALWPWLGERL